MSYGQGSYIAYASALYTTSTKHMPEKKAQMYHLPQLL